MYRDCFSDIQIELSDGQQDYYSVDITQGLVTFENKADRFLSETLELVLYFTSGEQEVIDPMTIVTACGPGSTDVVPPDLEKVIQPDWRIAGGFISTNNYCPIAFGGYVLVGDGGKSVTNEQVENFFDFNSFFPTVLGANTNEPIISDLPMFEIRLRDVYT